MSSLLLTAAMVLSAGAVTPGIIETTYNQHKNKGSTKVHGKAWVWEKDNGTIELQIEVTTKKSGLAGTGWGSTQVVFYNADGKAILDFGHTETVGARVPQGINEGESKKNWTVRKAKADEIAYWAVFTEIEDKDGVKEILDVLTKRVEKAVKDIGGLGKIDMRKQVEKDGVIIFKRR